MITALKIMAIWAEASLAAGLVIGRAFADMWPVEPATPPDAKRKTRRGSRLTVLPGGRP